NHAYPFKGDKVERWLEKMEQAAKTLPLIVSEFGSDPRGGAGRAGEQWVRQGLQILEDHQWAWTAWDLHTRASPCLISDWKCTPTPHFGAWVKKVLAGEPPSYPPPSSATQLSVAAFARARAPLGIFESHEDVGTVLHPGSVEFDAASRSYTVA